METKEIFAQRLVELREKRGITQQTLADDLGVTRQSLSLYEKAERTINIDLIVKIADYFNVSTDYLLGRTKAATSDMEIKAISEYTGLQPIAIDVLHNITPEQLRTDKNVRAIINFLLASDNGKKLLQELSIYIFSIFDKRKIAYVDCDDEKEIEHLNFNFISDHVMVAINKLLDKNQKEYQFLCKEHNSIPELTSSYYIYIYNHDFENEKIEESGDYNAHHNPPQE